MSRPKFTKVPLTASEREKKIEEFISLSDTPTSLNQAQQQKPKKEKTRVVYLRVPESLWDDIHQIMARTGLSMNAICLDLLRPRIKRKLKDLISD